MTYYCTQCFDSNLHGVCPLEHCERRFKETGSYRKKSQMTREEACKKIIDKCGWPHASVTVQDLVRALEALGLLKFEERVVVSSPRPVPLEEPKFTIMEAVKICRSAYIENDAFVAGLEKHGYKIVSIDE